MVNVFITVDVEIWCDGWHNIDEKFPDSFKKYIYGPTPKGDFGLPHKIKVLNQHGLKGVFFIEPLFSMHFGDQPLTEIVGLVNEGGQEVQLHLHTEWVDESKQPIFKHIPEKRQHLRYFSLEEQTQLIEIGKKLISRAGARDVNAFRAGSFAFNAETLTALAIARIPFDSSYNASMFGPDSGLLPGVTVVEPVECRGVYEYPMTVFRDGTRSLRHAQLTACSSNELERLLWQALETGRSSFVLLSHSFELMNAAMNRPDEVAVKRFDRLCAFLEKNADCFSVRGFQGLTPAVKQSQPDPLNSPVWMTGLRMLEQIYRRKYQ